jgi:hypothetical protein
VPYPEPRPLYGIEPPPSVTAYAVPYPEPAPLPEYAAVLPDDDEGGLVPKYGVPIPDDDAPVVRYGVPFRNE